VNWTTDLHTKVVAITSPKASLPGFSRRPAWDRIPLSCSMAEQQLVRRLCLLDPEAEGFDNVKLLNGGRKKWELESRTLVQDARRTRRPASRSKARTSRDPGLA